MWRRGSVIGSWLLDLTADALLAGSPSSTGSRGRVSDSGEGRWTVLAAIDEGVPGRCSPPRCSSASAREATADFANKVLSAMRKEFGGHDEKPGPK